MAPGPEVSPAYTEHEAPRLDRHTHGTRHLGWHHIHMAQGPKGAPTYTWHKGPRVTHIHRAQGS